LKVGHPVYGSFGKAAHKRISYLSFAKIALVGFNEQVRIALRTFFSLIHVSPLAVLVSIFFSKGLISETLEQIAAFYKRSLGYNV